MSARGLIDSLTEPGVLRPFLQPIFDLAGEPRVHGYEVLTRGPVGSTLESAPILFEYVRRKGLESVLDRLCVAGGFRAAAGLPADAVLSINVHAATLERDPSFVDFLLRTREGSEMPERGLSVEIVEHSPIWQSARLRGALAALRAVGVGIALDDIGCGQSTFRMLLEVRPEIFKLDRYVVQGCAADPQRAAIVAAVAGIAVSFSAVVVAEGIEEAADLAAVQELGVRFGQGYLLAEPFEPGPAVAGGFPAWKQANALGEVAPG